jgi:lipoate-protein ligase A
MKLYNLGKVPWQETQLIYHALAGLGREALVLVSPASPYVCIGYHQDVTLEVDTDFCRENCIPVFRRKVGGGAVYLDGDQLFFHLILRRDNPAIPPSKNAFYQKFLQPIIDIHHRMGIAAEYKPVNDIIVNNRKISGTGVGEIGESIVFVGNLILDFNYAMMSSILRVPDEKFRDKVRKTIEDNLTTIRREIADQEESEAWDESRLNELMADEFGKLLDPLDPGVKDDALITKMTELDLQMNTDAWLYRKGKPVPVRSVKVRSGVEVVHRMHKSPGGLIRADFEVHEGRLSSVSISGDFFCYPEDSITQLESMLEGTSTTEIQNVLKKFYSQEDIETPGVELQDWLKVLST